VTDRWTDIQQQLIPMLASAALVKIFEISGDHFLQAGWSSCCPTKSVTAMKKIKAVTLTRNNIHWTSGPHPVLIQPPTESQRYGCCTLPLWRHYPYILFHEITQTSLFIYSKINHSFVLPQTILADFSPRWSFRYIPALSTFTIVVTIHLYDTVSGTCLHCTNPEWLGARHKDEASSL